MPLDEKQVKIAIIGAGVSGICAGVALKRKLNFQNFLILERQSDLGGVWNENNYPGCRTDDLVHTYSLSYELKPDWSEYTASQHEYQEYWRKIVHKYELEPHLLYNTNVEQAEWDPATLMYTLSLHDSKTDIRQKITVHAVVSAVGYLSEPNIPDIPGKDLFQGNSFHSTRWRHDITFQSKRVGVIGNSATAAQVATALTEDPSITVHNFCRSPVWYAPHPTGNRNYSSFAKFLFAYVPGTARFYRNYLFFEIFTRIFLIFKSSWWLRSRLQKRMAEYLEKNVPEGQLDNFLPKYAFGCKRPVIDAGVVKSLRRPNFITNWEGIDSITAEGVKTKAGNIVPLDIIAYCTGYKVGKSTIAIKGKEGVVLSEYSKSRGGLSGYLGIAVPNFPNYFFLCGPNGTVTLTSVVYSAETEMEYILQLLDPIIKKHIQSIEVTEEAANAHNEWLDRRFETTVMNECASAYNLGGGKSPIIFPGSIVLLWIWTRWPRWDHYHITGGKTWTRTLSNRRFKWSLLGFSLAASAVGLLMYTGRYSSYDDLRGSISSIAEVIKLG